MDQGETKGDICMPGRIDACAAEAEQQRRQVEIRRRVRESNFIEM